MASGIPLFLLIFFALPEAGAPAATYGAVLLFTGLLISWCQGVNNLEDVWVAMLVSTDW